MAERKANPEARGSSELPTLRGRRVILRAPSDRDAQPLADILSEPAIARFWHGFDLARVRAEFIGSSDALDAGERVLVYIIEHEGEVAGLIQLAETLDPVYRHAGIDLFLGTRWHRQGLGGDAVRTLLAHAFGVRGHHRAVIDPSAENERAIRCYERVGFRRVGVMRKYERGPDGSWHDGVLMELLAEDLRED